MQYHLDTIPVWAAMELEGDCPLCAIARKTELDELDKALGGSVMDPDTRIRVNNTGICQKHQQALFQMNNRLGQALMMDSHLMEVIRRTDALREAYAPAGKSGLFAKKNTSATDALIDALERMSAGCVVCDEIRTHMDRYLYTFVHLLQNDKKFGEKWAASKGVCLPHAAELLRCAQKHMPQAKLDEFAPSLLALVSKQLHQNQEDLHWFTLKFDYRNADKPWGNSRKALERSVNQLRGWCLGDEPNPKK